MKRLILCCDGTWNKADQVQDGTPCPTNVVKLAYRIAKHAENGMPQVILYDQGVGTGNSIDRLTGGAFGEGLEDNIYRAYRFLIANYEPGDEIWLFGFSRGAFTARSIAGVIRKCGILSRVAVQHYVKAVELYRMSEVHPDDPTAVNFRSQFSCCGTDPIKIRFIGVWDTVGALGIPLAGLRGLNRRDYTFHDTALSGTVELAYHALALDEHREPFVPSLWMEKRKPNQTIEQMWFPGVHSDVGGGYPETAISDITLEWMMEKARSAGLALDPLALAAHPLSPNPTGVLHDSRSLPYKFMRGIDRPIDTSGSQFVHPSALARWDADPNYCPKNLLAWFKEQNDVRASRRC
jgi:uncharacterized protein (DUF2235 family)